MDIYKFYYCLWEGVIVMYKENTFFIYEILIVMGMGFFVINNYKIKIKDLL